MADDKTDDSGIDTSSGRVCAKHKVPLVPRQVTLSYLDAAFPVTLPACPECGLLYIPEELATDKILHVEQSLEDK